ncbi:MAG TPA: SUMF1/EgtB/PvdO family nonheme iron enzyme [Blastocatellia bacterium]
MPFRALRMSGRSLVMLLTVLSIVCPLAGASLISAASQPAQSSQTQSDNKAADQQQAAAPAATKASGSKRSIKVRHSDVVALPSAAKRYALIIGIDQYEDPDINPLGGAVRDAKSLKQALVSHCQFTDDNVILMTSDSHDHNLKPTRSNIIYKLSTLEGIVPPDGLLLFAFSGHGVEVDSQAFLLPMESKLSRDTLYLADNAISVDRVKEYVNKTGVKQRILFLDACRNKLTTAKGIDVAPMSDSYQKAFDFDLERKNRTVDAFLTFYATEKGQESWEDPETGQGYFTEAIVEALNGGRNGETTNAQGEITLGSLTKYVRDTVADRTKRMGKVQVPHPVTDGYGSDLILAKLEVKPAPVESTVATPAPPVLFSDTNAATEIAYWTTIANKTDPELFKEYLTQYPNGRFVKLAATIVRDLETPYWNSISSSTDPQAFKTYGDIYPDGRFVGDAKAAMQKLEEGYWDSAKKSGDPRALNAYVALYPDGRFVNGAKALLNPKAGKADGSTTASAESKPALSSGSAVVTPAASGMSSPTSATSAAVSNKSAPPSPEASSAPAAATPATSGSTTTGSNATGSNATGPNASVQPLSTPSASSSNASGAGSPTAVVAASAAATPATPSPAAGSPSGAAQTGESGTSAQQRPAAPGGSGGPTASPAVGSGAPTVGVTSVPSDPSAAPKAGGATSASATPGAPAQINPPTGTPLLAESKSAAPLRVQPGDNPEGAATSPGAGSAVTPASPDARSSSDKPAAAKAPSAHFGVKGAAPVVHDFRFNTIKLGAHGSSSEKLSGYASYLSEDVSGVQLKAVKIPAGTFQMGDQGRPGERPKHQVSINSFFMGEFEVTQALWRAVAKLPKVNIDLVPEPSYYKGDDLPVTNVSWDEAVEFCARLSKSTGRQYRLPTEAEWEYACRAGSDTVFAFGDDVSADFANFDGEHPYDGGAKGPRRLEPVNVGSLGVANAFGLYDLIGNASEWCSDVWHETYDQAPADGSSWDSAGDGAKRVVRGGDWTSPASRVRSAARKGVPRATKSFAQGFRIALGN